MCSIEFYIRTVPISTMFQRFIVCVMFLFLRGNTPEKFLCLRDILNVYMYRISLWNMYLSIHRSNYIKVCPPPLTLFSLSSFLYHLRVSYIRHRSILELRN